MSQASAFDYIRAGQTPFFRLPVALREQTDGDYRDVDAVLLGVPYDGGTTYQPGTRFAPYHVRRVSALVQGYHAVHGLDVWGRLRGCDGGNVAFPPFDPVAVRTAIEREVAAVYRAGATPFVCGGDHSITLPALRAAVAAHGPLAVIHLDAHFDTSGPEVWGEPFHHGTPIRHAIAERLIAPEQLFQVGLRATWGDPHEAKVSKDFGARPFPALAFEQRSARDIGAELRRAVGERPVFLTVDVDALDPAFAPGTGTPVPGGLTSREVTALLQSLAGIRLVGMDVVEVCPPLDHADLTCHLAAQLLFEGLALRALRQA